MHYQSQGTKVTVLLTNTKLGRDNLRVEQDASRCTESFEYGDGHVLQLSGGPDDGTPNNVSCQATRVVLVDTVR
ncbi:hypothetical protein FPZ12_015855 [Amycolatopsis acidicola]|uniref:Uncharacterized protein n=1 Tax=Amycolatopsis acidicola TaxID=2596893 RepID=A0A5N0V6S0_9PSEU|nr:hypothetical protein [Amycolatopsis acidicola]KAA9160883.1 hypothetical protein FPZ12_015855 [Amycolatopsis acidicola]